MSSRASSIELVARAVESVLLELDRGRAHRDRSRSRMPAIFAERLLSLRKVEGLAQREQVIRVAPGTVVTPLARDFLKRQGIRLQWVSRSEVEQSLERGEWGLVIASRSGLVEALRRTLLESSQEWRAQLADVESAASWVAASPTRGALVVTDEAAVAVWLACQRQGVRAAQATDVDAVDRAVRQLGVNLLVIEPAGKSIALLKQMSLAFQRSGAPRPVEELNGKERSV